MREEINWWRQASARDKEMAERLFQDELYEGAAFHAQQSAEKSLKALLVKHGREARTHACVQILKILSMEGLDVGPIELCAKKLDAHYIQSRYPNGAGGPPQDLYSKEIAEEAIECLDQILLFISRNL